MTIINPSAGRPTLAGGTLTSMSTFITVLDEGRGPMRVAVKDLIDIAGVPTTAGCRAVARRALPAASDAACLAGLRRAVASGAVHLVGKTNLHELAAGATGINPWFGTPRNPLDPRLVPGGSSSGSATAVGAGEADVALGTDTAGSVRIPAACCGVVGLKTTHGRIATAGVWPLAPSLDTVGPMARDVAGVIAGMQLLEPAFAPAAEGAGAVGRVRLGGEPRIEAAIDDCLRRAELVVTEARVPGWAAAGDATLTIIVSEAWAVDGHLLQESDGIGPDLRAALHLGATMGAATVQTARGVLAAWRAELLAAIDRHGPLVLPTLLVPPPTLAAADPDGRLLLGTAPVNGAGLPALALPVALPGGPPASLQVIGRPHGEEELVTLGRRLEAAIATRT